MAGYSAGQKTSKTKRPSAYGVPTGPLSTARMTSIRPSSWRSRMAASGCRGSWPPRSALNSRMSARRSAGSAPAPLPDSSALRA